MSDNSVEAAWANIRKSYKVIGICRHSDGTRTYQLVQENKNTNIYIDGVSDGSPNETPVATAAPATHTTHVAPATTHTKETLSADAVRRAELSANITRHIEKIATYDRELANDMKNILLH